MRYAKSVIKTVSDARVNDSRVRKIIKDKLPGIIKDNSSKRKHKYESRKVVDELDAYTIDDQRTEGFKPFEIDLDEDEVKEDLVVSNKKNKNALLSDFVSVEEANVMSAITRRVAKQAIKEVFHEASVQKDVKLSKDRFLKSVGEGFIDRSVPAISLVSDTKALRKKRDYTNKDSKTTKYTKAESQMLRDSNNKRKAFKKEKKKERQYERKQGTLVTEAGKSFGLNHKEEDDSVVDDLVSIDYKDLYNEVKETPNKFSIPVESKEVSEDENMDDFIKSLMEEREDRKQREKKKCDKDYPLMDIYYEHVAEMDHSLNVWTSASLKERFFFLTKKADETLGISNDGVDCFLSFVGAIMAKDSVSFFHSWAGILRYLFGDNMSALTRLSSAAVTTMCWKKFQVAKNTVKGLFVAESGEKHYLTEIGNLLEQGIAPTSIMLKGEFITTVRKLFIGTTSLKFFEKETALTIYKYLGNPDKSLSLMDTYAGILADVAKMFKFAGRIADGEPLMSVISGEDPLLFNLNKLRDLNGKKDLLYTSTPILGRTSELIWMTEAKDCIDFVNKIKNRYSPLSQERRTIDQLMYSVSMKRDDIIFKARHSQRVAPLVFIVTGTPGIGKSKIIDYIFAQNSLAMGRQYDPKHVYHKSKNAKFYDGYDPETHVYLHLSEVGNMLSARAAAQGDPSVDEFLSIVDSQPYCVDSARLEDKGKCYVKFQVVVIDTNCPDMNLKFLFKNYAAHVRRMIIVDTNVKKEFRKDTSDQIDPEKCAKSDKPFFDRWEFTVTEHEAKTNTQCEKFVRIENGDCYELADFILKKSVKHVRQEEAMIAKMSNPAIYEGYVKQAKDIRWIVPKEPVEMEEKFYSESGLVQNFMNGGLTGKEQYVEFSLGICKIMLALLGNSLIYAILRSLDKSNDFFTRSAFSALFFILSCFCYWIGFISFGGLTFMFFFLVTFGYLMSKWYIRSVFSDVLSTYENIIIDNADDFKRYFGCKKIMYKPVRKLSDYYQDVKLQHILIFATVGGAAALLYHFFKKQDLTTEESTDFIFDSVYNEKINAIEKKTGAGSSYTRIPSKVSVDWNNTQHIEISNPHTNGIEDLERTAHANTREVVITDRVNQKKWNTKGLGLESNVMLINTHALPEHDFQIDVSQSSFTNTHRDMQTTMVSYSNRVDLGEDQTLIWISGMTFKSIMRHIFDGADFPNALVGRFNGEPLSVTKVFDQVVTHKDKFLSVSTAYKYNYGQHSKGMCGTPLVAKFSNKSFILGFHFAGGTNSTVCLSIPFSQKKLRAGIDSFNTFMPINSMPNIPEVVLQQLDDSVIEAESGLDVPSLKSPLHYLELHNAMYYGKLPGEVMLNNRSSLTKGIFNDKSVNLVDFLGDVYGYKQKVKYMPPVMKPCNIDGVWTSPYNIFLEKFSQPKKSLDKQVLRKCIDVYLKKVVSNLIAEGIDFSKIRPLNVESCLNGVETDIYSRRISLSKAAGFGFPGKKKSHVEEIKENLFEPSVRLKREFFRIVNNYQKDKLSGFVYNAQLKDEPRDVEKVKAGKTRVFFASSFGSLMVSKCYLSPIYSLMVQFSKAFYTSIGVDMHRQADDLLKRFRWMDFMMAGDYGSFDTTIPFDISWAAATFVHELCRIIGYNEEALKVVKGILSDGLFPIVNMLKDIFLMAGLQPSGKYGTAEDNSIKGILLLMYCWYTLANTRDFDFFDCNDPNTYGDDVGNAVKPDFRPFFNDVIYSEFCKEHYNMKYTASDKGDVVKEFVALVDYTFLKRSFVFNKTLDRYVAPLDMDSIVKTLQWRTLSESISEIDQTFAMMTSCLYEFWFHSTEEQYKKVFDYLFNVFSVRYGSIVDGYSDKLPTYSQLIKTYNTSHLMEISEEDSLLEDDPVSESRTICVDDIASILLGSEDPNGKKSVCMDEQLVDKYTSANSHDLRKLREDLLNEMREVEMKGEVFGHEVRLREILLTVKVLDSILMKRAGIVTESGPEIDMKTGVIEEETKIQHENVMDIGGNTETLTHAEPSPYSLLKNTDCEVANFLMRPVEVYANSIPLNTDFNLVLNPWDLITSVPSVRAKLKNFSFIKMDLTVRIALSGTPFHMGKLQVAYVPFSSFNPIVTEYNTAAYNRYGFLQYLSQQKGTKVLDAKMNKPIEFDIPYFSPTPMARLFNDDSTALTSATSFNMIKDLGKIWIHSLNQFASVSSGSATDVYMYVYVFMRNVSLGAPTSTILELSTESGDERFIGPISGKAHMGMRFAKMFTSVPVLGPYAEASSIIFKGVRDIASYLGFSKPSNCKDPSAVKNEPFRNGANVIGMETNKRITLDPQQETSLEIGGTSSEDEMSYAYVMKREGLLTTFTWSPSDTSLSGSIFSLGVNPCTMIPYRTSVAQKFFQPTPLNMIANMHSYWCGTIKYRIEIVCTAFHRGKIAVVFEPNVAQFALLSAQLDLNKQYTLIIDLQETQDIEFCVDMAFPREWALTLKPSEFDAYNSNLGAYNLMSSLNGFIRFHAVTALQSPNGGGVEINLYMSSDDMHFNKLDGRNLPTVPTMVTESGNEFPIDCVLLNQSRMDDSKQSVRYFGEEPLSLRSNFKRYVTIRSESVTVVATDTSIVDDLPCFVPNAPTPTVGTPLTANWFSYLSQAYLGCRGGLKFRYYFDDISMSDRIWTRVSLADSSESLVIAGISAGNFYSRAKIAGTVNFAQQTNAGVEFEIPFYSNNLFVFCNSVDPWPLTDSIDRFGLKSFSVSTTFKPPGALRVCNRTLDFAIGEDFNFLYFTGSPPLSTL